MDKRIVLISLLLLTACEKRRTVACNLKLEDKKIDIDINANFDNIESVKIRTSFEIPYSILLNEEKINVFNSQLDDEYYYEDNLLIREYNIELDKTYSLSKTIGYLNREHYYCE